MANDMQEQEAPPVDPLTNYKSLDPVDDQQQMQQQLAPMYRVYKESKLPVSKFRGKLWKSRLDQADAAMASNRKAWQEAIRYYHNDHTRDSTYSDNAGASNTSAGTMRETENIVFANVSALVPLLYTKNPDAEFTAQNDDTKPLAEKLQKLVNTLAGQKTNPGLNLKRKVKRNITMTTLTNCAWFEVGYTLRDQSSDRALSDLQELSKKLEQAKDQNTIRETEGALMALEGKIDMLSPSGPWVKTRKPWEVRIDGAATELDLSDANWAIIEDMMPTSLLQALYGEKKENGDWVTVYEPTAILKNGSTTNDGTNLTGDNFVLFSKEGAGKSPQDYGYGDAATFRAAWMTKVYYVWDKATRRCELYADNSWQYPVWVWDDPYRLDQFFPLVPMEFHTDPVRTYAKGEVTYYLDQQDALNLMNNEFARIRAYASSLVGYNKNIIKDVDTLEQILAGTFNKRSVGFDLPEGMKLSDAISPLLPPSEAAIKYFDKRMTLDSIDRVSGVAAVQRGVEYKTNTTNRAIESYESQQQTRADEKMDAIEESVGTVLWLVAQMCLQFMSPEDVTAITGDAEGWERVEPRDIALKFSPRVVGGSTLKPSSRSKKEQALQISQTVGQFAKASPVAALVAMKVLATAFHNEVVISPQDWEMMMQSLQAQIQAQQMQAQQPQGPAQQQPQQAQQGEGGEQQQQPGAVGDVIKQTVVKAAQLIDAMPPELRQEIGVMLARQIPVQQIAAEVIGKLEQPK